MRENFRLPHQPVIYEINTTVFLSELSKKYSRVIKLGTVPEEEWKAIAALPVDAVWLMGVWERSPYSVKVSAKNPEFQKTLHDFSEKDNIGSAYSVRSYEVDMRLGGSEGLAKARASLKAHGVGLILDFVPNHVACDHAWVKEHPDYLLAGNAEAIKRSPKNYFKSPHGNFAFGKDPEFPPWTDVLQLNAFSRKLREAAGVLLLEIATMCDGVRCDMAMLLTNAVFHETWGDAVEGELPTTEYWVDVISLVRKVFPDFVFVAEVYWNWERRLLAQGFDYCYDKTLYDRLDEGTSLELFHYIHADPTYQHHLLRFIENHDEPRAAVVFKGAKQQVAAFILATLPGATMYHQGQFEGFVKKLPVHLDRGPEEAVNSELRQFYTQLLGVVAETGMRDGIWQLAQGNSGLLRTTKLVAWLWTRASTLYICVVNYNRETAAGRFAIPVQMHQDFTIPYGEEHITEKGAFIRNNRLWVELHAWGYALFRLGS